MEREKLYCAILRDIRNDKYGLSGTDYGITNNELKEIITCMADEDYIYFNEDGFVSAGNELQYILNKGRLKSKGYDFLEKHDK